MLRSVIIASLSEKYRIVETPAQDVLRVSLALADIRVRERSHSSDTEAQPVFQPCLIVLIGDSASGEAIAGGARLQEDNSRDEKRERLQRVIR